MPRWSNWSGRHKANPDILHFLRSEEDAAALVSAASQAGKAVRVAGSGHSHSGLVPSDDTIVDVSGLAGVISVDTSAKRARVYAGTKIHALGRPLHDAGLALFNQGDIDRQAIAGATATGTHGTGSGLTNLSASVTGLSLVLSNGHKVWCSKSENADLWKAARLNLGAVGLVTQLELQLRDAYKLEERGWQEPLESLLPRIDELTNAHRHFEFFWSPATDEVFAKTLDEITRQPEYPLAEEGSRCAWSYEVLPNHRPHLHSEMEYSVPAEEGIPCLLALRELITKRFPDLRWPVEYRTLAADDIWISTAHDRETVTLSVHQGIDEPDEPLFRACEEIFLTYGGRPHWGKVHYLDGAKLKNVHPAWDDWWHVRDAHDPKRTFLNDYMKAWRD